MSDEVVITIDERRILEAAARSQVDLATSPMGPLKPNPARADRWREIADALQMGRPVLYRPSGKGAD